MFDKTRARINQQVEDRVTAPVRTSVVLSLAAIVIAAIALIVTVNRAGN